ncbi:MAG: MBL fold metallo-hydrolase [Bacteroidetes bacterium]|nr:MBL fold metallo-hydrolase [Bacteroidota bacterium]
MQVFSVNAGHFKLDGGAMFGVVPKSLWSPRYAADDNNMCSWAMRCMLVQRDNRLVLIDTGMGNKQDDKFFSYYYMHGDDTLDKSLAAAGFHRDDITDVFLTHLHFDHCGGAVEYDQQDKLIPAFRNATFWSNKEHWDWAVNPNPRERASFLKENILPMQESGQLRFLDSDELFPGFAVEKVSGHTESMMLPVIEYKGHKIMYMADLLPSPVHVPTAWVMAYDTRPLLTMQEKQVVLNRCVDENRILFFEHDKSIECATLIRTEKGIRVGETFPLSSI